MWLATVDQTPYLCIPEAMNFRKERIRYYCFGFAREGGRAIAKILGPEVMENTQQTLGNCSFTNVRLRLDFYQVSMAELPGCDLAHGSISRRKILSGQLWCCSSCVNELVKGNGDSSSRLTILTESIELYRCGTPSQLLDTCR